MSGKKKQHSSDFMGCRVRGPLHVQMRLPNQDAWLVRHYATASMVVVADGLGSKSHSDVGSYAACRAVAHVTRQCSKVGNLCSPQEFVSLMHERWLSTLYGFSPRDCATTCLFAVKCQGELLLGRLGDGMIAAHAHAEDEDVLIFDDKAESFANMTECLHEYTSASNWELRLLSASKYKSVLLCSDGVADDLERGQELSFSRALVQAYSSLDRRGAYHELRRCLLHWPRPGHTDDKTLAVMHIR